MRIYFLIVLSALLLASCAHPCYVIWDEPLKNQETTEEWNCVQAKRLCKQNPPCDFFYEQGGWYYRIWVK